MEAVPTLKANPSPANYRNRFNVSEVASLDRSAGLRPTTGTPLHYQIWQRSFSGRTIGSPALQENAAANCGMFERGPLTLNFGSGCGSTLVNMRASSGLLLVAQPRS